MRLRIDAAWSPGAGWIVTFVDLATMSPLRDASGNPVVRALGCLPMGSIEDPFFPLPPVGDAGPDHRFDLEAGAEALADAYRDIMNRQPGIGGVKRFGQYLFATLLGSTLWSLILESARDTPIELSLGWDDANPSFNRLPWEMMHDDHGFLARREEPPVAITRRVMKTAASLVTGAASEPARVLFVVGTSLAGDVIRPGAEFLGMLRMLRHSKLDLRIKPHLLLEANRDRLVAAIKSFRPIVLHVICHGSYDEQGNSVLELMPQNSGEPTDLINGREFATLLGAATEKPKVVVLNACYSANLDAKGPLSSSFAAELVRGGVPIVVGMAGEVADRACRLFTRCFYEAIVRGDEIVQAAARGRSLGVINYGAEDPASNVDWALPILFLAENVTEPRLPAFSHVAPATWYEASKKYWNFKFPAFCGRLDVLRWYDLLMTDGVTQMGTSPGFEPREFQYLAVKVGREEGDAALKVGEKFGHTFVMRALAALAARDGHLPLLLQREELIGKEWPKDRAQIIDAIQKVAALTATHFNLMNPRDPNHWKPQQYFYMLERLTAGKPAPADFPPELSVIFDAEMRKPDSPEVIAAAITMDLMALLTAARARWPVGQRAGIKLLFVIDDAHELGYSAAQFLFQSLLGPYGLSAAREDCRGAVASVSVADIGEEQTFNVTRQWEKDPIVMTTPLARFGDVEDRIAYRQFLLNWREENDGNGKEMPLVVAPEHDPTLKEQIAWFYLELDKAVEGYPSRLPRESVNKVIDKFLIDWPKIFKKQLLRVADDEQYLELIYK